MVNRSGPNSPSQPITVSGARTDTEPTTTRVAPASRMRATSSRERTPPPVCTFKPVCRAIADSSGAKV